MPSYIGTVTRDHLPSSEQRRLAILDATLHVMGAGGIDAVTHRKVAEAAGVPLGSTTYYFESRDDLIRQACRHYFAGVLSFADALVGEFTVRDPEALVEYWVQLVHRQLEERDLLLAEYEIFLYAARDDMLAKDLNAWERAATGRLGDALERFGVHRPLESARLFQNAVRGYELERLTHAGTTEAQLRDRLRTIMNAIVPGGGPYTGAPGAGTASVDRGEAR